MQTLMPIGGAMNRKDPTLLREFIRRAGGVDAHIVILPQASKMAGTSQIAIQQFLELGAGYASALTFHSRDQVGTPEQIELLRSASGIFFTGGTQMRIPVLIGGTRLEKELMTCYQNGCLVGGTSAGAAILSKTMIAYGRNGPTPREGITQLSPGLGFTDQYIFDPHFRQRDRLGRLTYAVSCHPGLIGIGIDENTAVVIEDDDLLTVYGSGAITIVDGSQISTTDVAEVGKRGAVGVTGLTVHILTGQGSYQRQTRTASLPSQLIQNE